MFGFDIERFLKRDWQRAPRLLKRALRGFSAPIDEHDLAALACEPESISRLIEFDGRRKRFKLEYGPFDEARLGKLPRSNWTLLVQDVDKWLPEVMRPLLSQFQFLPSWRVEDLMVSFATAGGSVGAHVDQYDVFLLQARGRRHWLIDDRAESDLSLDHEAPLKLLKHFKPNKQWVLEPGDMLYLPPGVPHHGVALDDCMTFSIGLRAPSDAEALAAVAIALTESVGERARYTDAKTSMSKSRHELDAAAIKRFRKLMLSAVQGLDDQFLEEHLGRFLARYRAPRALSQVARPLKPQLFERELGRGATLVRDEWQRMLWTRREGGALMHAQDFSVLVPIPVAEKLCGFDGIDAAWWTSLSVDARHTLWQMYAAGVLILRPARRLRRG
jgi:50S ribosomal protein L16 3-hydroxylase